jgi:hypothetical protein
MRDEHFSYDTVELFFRSELPQSESMRFIRHLLRQCPSCSRVLREIAQRRNFRVMLQRSVEGLGEPCEVLLDRLKGRTGAKSRTGVKPRAGSGPWRLIRRV